MARLRDLRFGTKSRYAAPPAAEPLCARGALVHVSLVARHGTRNPTRGSLCRMRQLEAWVRARCRHFAWLEAWAAVLARYEGVEGALTGEGESECWHLGERFWHVYGALVGVGEGAMRVRSSFKERAVGSARAFVDGYLAAAAAQPGVLRLRDQFAAAAEQLSSSPLSASPSPLSASPSPASSPLLPSPVASSPLESPPVLLSSLSSLSSALADTCALSSSACSIASTSASASTTSAAASTTSSSSSSSSSSDDLVEVLEEGADTVLRFFDTCESYVRFAEEHKRAMKGVMSAGALVGYARDMAVRMSNALGADCVMDLDFVRVVAEACAFDYAHGRGDSSLFCTILNPTDAAYLEFFERSYRPFFKGHDRFRAVAAPLVADIVQSLTACIRARTTGESCFAADLRFAHAETLVPLLLLLGIRSNGLSPSHQDYRDGLSAMSPFAGNFAIELYEAHSPTAQSYYVRFRLHERYVARIPALGVHGQTGVVELDRLLEFFAKVLEEGMPYFKDVFQ